MEHPAGKYRSALLGLRTVQVIISLISVITSAFALAVVSRELQYIQKHTTRYDTSLKPVFGGMIGALVFGLVLSITCFITCTLWLFYTAKPSARARSCGGNKPACMRYSCDMGWDIFWSVLWAVSFIMALITRFPTMGAKIGNIISSLVILALFITTAVISGKVRKNLTATGAVKDIEAPGGFKPFEAPTAPTFRV